MSEYLRISELVSPWGMETKKLRPGKSTVIAQRLREARERAGLSQKQLGILAGVDEFSASTRINQYEQNVHHPDFDTLERIAEVLSVPTPYFYARDDKLAEWILRFTDNSH